MRMRTKGPRPDKVAVVAGLEELLSRTEGAILTHYRGMTMADISRLRGKLRDSGGEYHVVKNTLFRRALGAKLTPELSALLEGPTGVAFATQDPIETTKALLAFLKELRKPDVAVKAGWVFGTVYSPDQVVALSKIPPREVVLAQTVGAIQSPASAFAGTLHGVLSEFARTLQAKIDKDGAPADPVEPVETEAA